MSSEDQNYLSWMAGMALAVLMVIVMFWIRSQIPDAVSSDAGAVPTVVAESQIEGSDALSPTRDAIASVYECVSGGSRTLSDRPCGAGAVLRQIGVPQPQRIGDASVIRHR